jgi:hypothetical protein
MAMGPRLLAKETWKAVVAVASSVAPGAALLQGHALPVPRNAAAWRQWQQVAGFASAAQANGQAKPPRLALRSMVLAYVEVRRRGVSVLAAGRPDRLLHAPVAGLVRLQPAEGGGPRSRIQRVNKW